MARRNKGLVRFVLLVIVPAVVLITAAQLYVAGIRYVTTDNAYVKSSLVAISADVDGRVTHVDVSDNELVAQGQVLFRVDPEPFQIAEQMARAELATVATQVEAMRAEYRQAQVELNEAEQNIDYYSRVFARQQTLSRKGVATRAKYDEAENDLATSRQRASALKEKMERLRASLGGRPDLLTEQHPMYLEAKAKRDMAALDLKRTVVRAPITGIVGSVNVQVGEFVEKGEKVFPMVQAANPWIEANLKETQLTALQVGQSASVSVDAYPDHEWTAKVASISPSTGAEFAILPPQNATGNWVKVVQRVPVRLEIEQPVNGPQLRAGMTVTVRIDTEQEHSLLSVIGTALAWKSSDKK